MPISFGSVGDIIAVVQTTVQLSKALKTSGGSSEEFRDVILELETFQRALEQLVLFWQTKKQCALLAALDNILYPVIKDCRETITSFRDDIVLKYDKTLGDAAGSRLSLGRAGKMLQWHVFRSEEVTSLRDKISRSTATISMIQGLAQWIGVEQDGNLISQRLGEIKVLQAQTHTQLDKNFKQIEGKVQEQSTVLSCVFSKIETIAATTVSLATVTVDIRDRLLGLGQDMQTFTKLIAGYTVHTQESVLLEDALGYSLRMPLDIVRSWHTVDSILYDKFRDRPGREMVKNRRYIIQDRLTGTILRQDIPFIQATRPGQKLLMAMVFYSKPELENICPRCNVITVAGSSIDVECSNPECDMIYGRVTDVTDMEAFSASQPSVPPANRRGENYHGHKYKEEEPQKCIEEMDDHVLDDDIVMVDTVPAKFLTPNRVEDGPEIFKRVRFITRWEDSEESRGSLLWSSGTASCWCVAGPARDSMSPILRILVKYIGSNMPPMPKDVAILAGIFFIGANRQDSKPVLVVYANSEKWHQIAAHKARKWLRLNKLKSRLHLVSSTGGLFKSSVDRFLTRKEEKRALERSKSNEEEREESMEERLKRKKQNELIRLQFGPETLRLTTQLKTTLPPEERISIEKRLRVLEYLSLPRY